MFTITARAARRVAGLFLLAASAATTLVACGGGQIDSLFAQANDNHAPTGRVTITGADGASVSFAPFGNGNEKADAVTVRVARDGSGAPPLPEGYTPAGGVYAFTPLGMATSATEVRVPFDAQALGSGEPKLMISLLDGTWAEVGNARVENQQMVAMVPMLSHATVAVRISESGATGRAAEGQAQKVTGTAGSIEILVDPTTTPAWPLPDATGTIQITRATNLVLRANYTRGSVCINQTSVSIVGLWRPQGSSTALPPQQVTLLNAATTTNTGSATASQALGVSQNGSWSFYAKYSCFGLVVGGAYSIISVQEPTRAVSVNIQPTAAPTITAAPQNASVIEGQTAAFSVTASGTGLAYQWQRSNNGGTSYANVAGATAASTSLATTLADNGSLWRVIVTNAGGSATSAPARLSVAQRIVAPAVTSDPANQSVTEGKTASFTVVGTGTPVPTVQWQTRATANSDPNFGWSDLSGATTSTYTTPTTTLTQNGRQYRAVLRNSGGSATSLPATLIVEKQGTAPSITVAPLSQSVQAGRFGLFSVTASGTSPLSHQWFKNGVKLTGENASELLVLADPANVRSSYQITVQVSNKAGSVTSAAAVMTITPAPIGGTLIKSSEGGVLTTGSDSGPALAIPAGALATDTSVSFSAESSAAFGLPGITTLGSGVSVGPASLGFVSPATLTLPAPTAIPEGKVLAVVELPATATLQKLASQKTHAPSYVGDVPAAAVNLRRIASDKPMGGVIMMAPGDPYQVLCVTAQGVRGGAVIVDLLRAGRYITAAVDEGSCSGSTTKVSRKLVPSTSTNPCTKSDYKDRFAAGADGTLVSRHVHCQTESQTFTISDGQGGYYGDYRWEFRSGSHGAASLTKSYRFEVRLVRVAAGNNAVVPIIKMRPVLRCNASPLPGACAYTTRELSVQASVLPDPRWTIIDVPVAFSWSGDANTWTEFTFDDIEMEWAGPGQALDGSRVTFFGRPPSIRCDNGMAADGGRTSGCVYAQAPAVFVQASADPLVREAAAHIREAQTAGAPGALGFTQDGVPIASAASALQRTRVVALQTANNNFACKYVDSVIKLRPQASASCSPQGGVATCDCDEFPFKSSWNGALLERNSTSARYVRSDQNQESGRRLGRFYVAERVLDYTVDPGVDYVRGDEARSIPQRAGGDSFWVHVE